MPINLKMKKGQTGHFHCNEHAVNSTYFKMD